MRGKITLNRMSGILFVLTLFLGSLFLCPIKVSAASTDLIPGLEAFMGDSSSNVLVVGDPATDGSFETVTEAVNVAVDGDIILIYPGEYDESLDVRDKDLTFLGLDKDTCIIKYDTAHYSTPVLNGAAGTFCNLTFYGYKEKKVELKDASGEIVTPDNLDDLFSGYVIHIDDDFEYCRSITFNNCNIISENNNCVGMGLRNHFTATFNNCYFRSVGVAGILFIHDPDNYLFAGDDMHVVFKDNIWVNFGYPYLINFKSIYYANSTDITFQNVTTYCYATDTEEFYFPGNACTMTDIRYLAAGIVPTSSPLYILETGRITDCIKLLRKQDTHGLPGIYYIPDGNVITEESEPFIASLYYVVNPYNLPGDGFAGSCTFHLNNDSFGNTLEEMNVLR